MRTGRVGEGGARVFSSAQARFNQQPDARHVAAHEGAEMLPYDMRYYRRRNAPPTAAARSARVVKCSSFSPR